VGRIQHSVEAVERILAEHGSRSAQHVVDLMQAAIRRRAPLGELEDLEIMMKMIEADTRSRLFDVGGERPGDSRPDP
jgi:hypothetical protein